MWELYILRRRFYTSFEDDLMPPVLLINSEASVSCVHASFFLPTLYIERERERKRNGLFFLGTKKGWSYC